MPYTWPSTLPQKFAVEGASEDPPDNVIRSQPTVGPAKLRKRSTAAVRNISVMQYLTDTQVEILDAFHEEACASQFTGPHPRTGVDVSMRFVTPPKYSTKQLEGSADYCWVASYQFEIMP